MANQDIAAFACYDDKAFIDIFFVRSGRVTGRQSHTIDGVGEMSDAEIMTEFLKRFYVDAAYIPDELIVQCDIEERELFIEWMSGRLGHKLIFTVPQRGDKSSLIKMALKNVELSIGNYKLDQLKKESQENTLAKLAEYLELPQVPNRIESYDISNIAGTSNVGVMVVFQNGVHDASLHRKFQIRSFEGQDDYMAMAEVLTRRLGRAASETDKIAAGTLERSKAKFLPLPDLILLDGGQGACPRDCKGFGAGGRSDSALGNGKRRQAPLSCTDGRGAGGDAAEKFGRVPLGRDDIGAGTRNGNHLPHKAARQERPVVRAVKY